MSTTPQYAYDFDPYGTNANNRITDERHTITPASGQDFNYFIPAKAPFHRRNFVMRALDATGKTTGTLTATKDFYFGFRYDQMMLSGGMQPIYGSIVMNDPAYAGKVAIDYNTVGGEYVLSVQQVLTIMANNLLDPRTAQWTAVSGAPTAVPPVPHVHNAMQTMVGLDQVVDSLYVVIDSVSSGFNKAFLALQEHIRDHNNPHQVTAQQVGVDGDGTLIPATVQMVIDGTDNNRYITSYLLAQYSQVVLRPMIDVHAKRTDNPHGVTAAQVGLGNVPNYPVATASEASAGVATNRLITPATLLNAMQYQVPLIMSPHTTDLNNPHKVTKAQVGLGQVENFPVASVQAAVAGTDNTSYMTPYLVAQAVATGSGQGLSSHLNDFANPHRVTKAQVGLSNVQNYGIATIEMAKGGTDNTTYMTPYLVAQAMAAGNGESLLLHIADHDNPHQVTAAQVGLGKVQNYGVATLALAIGGTDNATYMTPYLVAQAIAAGSGQGLSSHLVDYANPHRVTKAQVGLSEVHNFGVATIQDGLDGTAADLYLTPYVVAQMIALGVEQDLSTHMVDYNNPHRVTAEQVGLGNVKNYPMATDTDIRLMNNREAYVSPADLGALAGVIQDNIVGNLLPSIPSTIVAPTMSADLYAAISTRYPYEYAMTKPELYGRRWFYRNNVYGPGAGAARSVVMMPYFPDGTEQLQGTLTVGGANLSGLVLGDVTYTDLVTTKRVHAAIVARIQATSVDFVLLNLGTGDIIPLTSIAATTIASSSSPRSWTVQFTVDANGVATGWKVTIDGTVVTLTLDAYLADTASNAISPSMGLGFAFIGAGANSGITLTKWLTVSLYMIDLSSGTDACYQYTDAAGWQVSDYDTVAARITKGCWYHNRYTLETFGALTAGELVPFGDRNYGVVAGVPNTMALGSGDITMDV